MSTTSVQLKLTLQELDDNPDTWGEVLNVSTIELLEDAIAGLSNPDVTLGNVILDLTAGGDELGGNTHYRKMIAEITGAPNDDVHTVTAPDLTGIWVVFNNTSINPGDVTFKTLTGAGILVPAGATYLCWSDGADMRTIDVAVATLAQTADVATNALALGGDDEALFPRLATAVPFTAGQSVARIDIDDDNGSGQLIADLALSNTFFHQMTQGENLATPLNPDNGAAFSLVVEQGVGAPHGLTFQANTFIWASATVPTLSMNFDDVDYFAFEYVTGLNGFPSGVAGARWIGSIIKGAS